jgi:hypothetical protein
MFFDVDAPEKFWLQIAALDLKARQDLNGRLGADHLLAAKASGVVSIEPARYQHLHQQALLIDRPWRHQQTAVQENAVAPNVAPGK